MKILKELGDLLDDASHSDLLGKLAAIGTKWGVKEISEKLDEHFKEHHSGEQVTTELVVGHMLGWALGKLDLE